MKDYYEPPFRPAFENTAALGWLIGGVITLGWVVLAGAPLWPAVVITAVCWGIGYWRYVQGVPHADARRRLLLVNKLTFMAPELAARWYRWSASRGKLWLGEGYSLTPDTAEKIKMVADRGLDTYLDTRHRDDEHGIGWIQEVEPNKTLELDLKLLDGHTLVVGTTGTGKTRLFDHIIGQAVRRNEAVIALDPKGDHDLQEVMQNSYARIGHPDRFCAFRPAAAEKSVRINPLGNWTRTTEVASRVAALVEADGTFLAFVWRVLNNLVQGELLVGRKPDLLTLRRLVEHGPEALVLEALRKWCSLHAKPEEYLGYVNNAKTKNKGGELEGYIEFYNRILSRRAPSLAVEGIISDVEHNREHFSKMVVSLTPVLTMLTTPPLDELLSPHPRVGDTREIVTIDKIVNQRRGLYAALSSMADPVVGAAIGSILLADLAAYTGFRYDNNDTEVPVNLFCDEVAEITNPQLTQILNKGRGGRVRATIATQTLSDLTARLGNEAKALQQIGNCNNIIILRVQDPETALLLSKGLPTFKARSVNRSFSQSLQPEPHSVWSGGIGESMQQETVPFLTPDMLMRLPPFHYIGRFSDGRIVKGRIPIVGTPRP